jgi:hypothetical protein
MLALFIVLFLLILLFGGLGIWVAKAFLIAALVALAVSIIFGAMGMRRTY